MSEDVLAALGPTVAGCLPLVITRKGAMTREAFNLVNAAVSRGAAFDGVAAQLRELHHSAYWEAGNYFTEVAAWRDKTLHNWLANSLHKSNPDVGIDPPTAFSSIDGQVGGVQ